VTLSDRKPDPRLAFVFDDVVHLGLDQISAEVGPEAPAQILIKDSTDVMVSGCHPNQGPAFFSLHGGCHRINVIGNDLSWTSQPILFDPPSLEAVLFTAGNRNHPAD
jgi:hypothetical protein